MDTTKSPSRTCGNTGAGGASYFYQFFGLSYFGAF